MGYHLDIINKYNAKPSSNKDKQRVDLKNKTINFVIENQGYKVTKSKTINNTCYKNSLWMNIIIVINVTRTAKTLLFGYVRILNNKIIIVNDAVV